MSRRFELALDLLKPSDWGRFEKLCSEFLAPEWPKISTVASPSGDKGRDAELFSPDGEPNVLIQYSVTGDWKRKIRDTASTIRENFSSAQFLVFMSNQKIGAQADDLKKELRTAFRLVLDIRDANWFVERAKIDPYRDDVAEQLARDIADPYVTSGQAMSRRAQALSNIEARSALVYLSLQWEDDTREKGLTKVCFEALVKSALRETTPENRMSRSRIKEVIRGFLPTHRPDQVDFYTDAALGRMKKRSVNYFGSDDQYCLSHDERRKLAEALAKSAADDVLLDDEIAAYVQRRVDVADPKELEENVQVRVRRVLEKFLLASGEVFASSVSKGAFVSPDSPEVLSILMEDARTNRIELGRTGTIDLVRVVVEDILTAPTESIRRGLRSLADAYTLMAFLRETPDVQSVVVKVFSHGDIWLDTSILLPLFCDDLQLAETEKFVVLVRAAVEAGLRLHITSGVLQEVERHLNRSLAYARPHSKWIGRAPFLYLAYALSGRSRASFATWVERFRGSSRPEDDIAAYLADGFSIDVHDLEAEVTSGDPDLRYAAERQWTQVHEKRRSSQQGDIDDLAMLRLVQHDVENLIGVVSRRRKESKPSLFGFTNWSLTLDRSAPEVFRNLRVEFPDLLRTSPYLSADFLLNYLAFGPVRRQVSKSTEAGLPVVLQHVLFPVLPNDLLEVAERVRSQYVDMPEYVVRRRIRDELDKARLRLGPVSMGGLDDVDRAFGGAAPKAI